jgi:hypothetical protein
MQQFQYWLRGSLRHAEYTNGTRGLAGIRRCAQNFRNTIFIFLRNGDDNVESPQKLQGKGLRRKLRMRYLCTALCSKHVMHALGEVSSLLLCASLAVVSVGAHLPHAVAQVAELCLRCGSLHLQ